jgi:hypothetical protein
MGELMRVAARGRPRAADRPALPPTTMSSGWVKQLLTLQRLAGNQAVAAMVLQRKTVTQLSITAELSDNPDFRELVEKVKNGGPPQTQKLAKAFSEAAADSSEDPAKLVAAMAIAWEPLLNAIRPKTSSVARTAETDWKRAKVDVDVMARKRRQEILEKAREEAAAKELAELNEEHANAYWTKIQNSGVGTAQFGAPLEFLRIQGFVTIEKPHRSFLSSWERDSNGNRDSGKFGISSVLTPSAKIRVPGPKLVLHMHCRRDGSVLSAGIKYENRERLAGDNVVLENLTFLTLDFGLTGENVESEVATFD